MTKMFERWLRRRGWMPVSEHDEAVEALSMSELDQRLEVIAEHEADRRRLASTTGRIAARLDDLHGRMPV